MKLTHEIFSKAILFEENIINVLVIERPSLFLKMLEDLWEQCRGEDGKFILSRNDSIVDIAGNMELITDIFNIDINSKKILNRIFKNIETEIINDYYMELQELNNIIIGNMAKFVRGQHLPLEFTEKVSIANLLKLVDLKIAESYENRMELLVNYIDIISQLFPVKLFILVNLKTFFDTNELSEFYKDINYKKLNVLLIEQHITEKLEGERYRIIDADLCELY